MPARGVSQEPELGVTASADEEALWLDNGLGRPPPKQQLCVRATNARERTEGGEEGRDPRGREFRPRE